METRHQRHRLPAIGATFVLVTLGGCIPGGATQAAGTYDEVVIALPSWAGGQANAAVAAHILSEELDVPVRLRSLEQTQAWDELDQDNVQAVLEDWGGVPDKENRYVLQQGTVVSAGDLGPVGRVGWYVPGTFAGQHPDVLEWESLNDHADEFATRASGDSGQLLIGHPDDVTHDEDLLAALDLDFTTVPTAGENDLVDALRHADGTGAPLLAHLWQPHWLHDELDLAEVTLPPHTPECRQADSQDERCGYPDIPLRKFLNADFAEEGGTAAAFLAGFHWTAEEQNAVARLIEGEDMTPEGAAEQWVEEHPERVADLLSAAN